MNFVPGGKRVLVERTVADVKSPGGIIMPDTAIEKPSEGKVVAVGEEVSLKDLVGKRILFGKYSGTEVIVNGSKLILMLQDEVFGHYND